MSGFTSPLRKTRDANTNAADDFDHIFCCDPNIGLCGTDLTDVPEAPLREDAMCVVCEDLEFSDAACRGCAA